MPNVRPSPPSWTKRTRWRSRGSGDRIRVGGTAELAGYSLALREARRDTLNHVLTDLFPHAGDVSKGEFWTGLRPMTPDGTPVVGGTPYPNLYLATGHGTLGWTMAAGTGTRHGRPAVGPSDGHQSGRTDHGAIPPILHPRPLRRAGRLTTTPERPALADNCPG